MKSTNKYIFFSNRLTFSLLSIILTSFAATAQQGSTGILKGSVLDGTTGNIIFNAGIAMDSAGISGNTNAGGQYNISVRTGMHNIIFSMPGFQTKRITGVPIQSISATNLSILLYPVSLTAGTYGLSKTDSLPAGDSLYTAGFLTESQKYMYNPAGSVPYLSGSLIASQNISSGTDKNGLLLVKRLTGLIVEDNPVSTLNQSFLVSGMGGRYNQLTMNGSVMSSFDPVNSAYPLELLPSQAIDEVSLREISDGSLPANFAGGTINIRTKDHTDKNFFSIEVNGGFSEGTAGNDFYRDSKSSLEFAGISGTQRSLPGDFPTTRSQLSFDQYNIQEQVFLSQQLKNNLAPQNEGRTPLNERILLGFGHNFKLKSGARISLVSYINQMQSRQINEAAIQVYPDLISNPNPYIQGSSPLIRSQSSDTNYNYTSQLALVLNASIVYGKSKISFRNYLGSQLANIYTTRYGIDKPDEDSLAHRGIDYLTTQRYFYTTQLSGDHALGIAGKLHMNWQATYTYYNQQNPDERQFLLREQSSNANLFEIASPQTAGLITNTGRLWRNLKQNDFTASVNLSTPFNMFHQAQILSGGLYIQENYREFYSDLFFTQGAGYTTQDKLIDPARYFPGSVQLSNYYINTIPDPTLLTQNNRGNYTGSSNLGAAYIRFESHLSKQIQLDLGFRMESNSQLVNNVQYRYYNGFKNPQLYPVSENTRITTFNPLPAISIIYSPLPKLKIWGSYFASVNRPALQELTGYAYYNAQTFMMQTGNALLATTNIDNWNAGINWVANAFSNFGVTGFYKRIDQPIENIVSPYTYGTLISTPFNTPPATVSGLSAELSVRLGFIPGEWLSHLTVFADGTITNSKAEAGPVRSLSAPDVSEHTLSGTPDHTFRAGLLIQQPKFPEISLIYRNTGGYITALGSGLIIHLPDGNDIRTLPDYRMNSRQQMDIQISQRFYKGRIQLTAGVNNLISGTYTEYQDLNGNKKFDAPVNTRSVGNSNGYYESGTDNTVISIKQLPTYYFALSYSFK